ncbi:MAG: hypothetical protein IT489_04465, partial [Gammaproteobacteria bacterium]|nr:hypothetical protein [Gammaproteobacteria bacterium]
MKFWRQMSVVLSLSLCAILFSSFSVDAQAALVAHWTFDEASGTVAGDASGNGNTGTLIGGPTWVAGQRGGALSF